MDTSLLTTTKMGKAMVRIFIKMQAGFQDQTEGYLCVTHAQNGSASLPAEVPFGSWWAQQLPLLENAVQGHAPPSTMKYSPPDMSFISYEIPRMPLDPPMDHSLRWYRCTVHIHWH